MLNTIRSLPYLALLEWLNQECTTRGLVSGGGRPLRFVPQEDLPAGAAYESWIADTGCVPTRDNLHDRYNAMVWQCCPETKARLNHLQAAQLLLHGSVGVRGKVRDAATLWDENLMVLACNDRAEELVMLLAAADWPGLFLRNRDRWHRDWHPVVFGHALLEKFEHPYKSITAHCVVLESVSPQWALIDPQLARRVTTELGPRALHPLPVMGIPGWREENASASFYQDAAVFRPRRGP
ncbi:MAG: DUF3025 domain-containing protein [Burkholderiaceae bacterium]|nr:DUF3025 domain-containing protein [Burkholderiaceae bacterium]